MKRFGLAIALAATHATADDTPAYQVFGDEVAFYAEVGLCTEKPSTELETCLNEYRAVLAEGCILESIKSYCDHFKNLTNNEGFQRLQGTNELVRMLTPKQENQVSANP